MADASPGPNGPPDDEDERSNGSADDATKRTPRNILNRVSFFEEVWRGRSPSGERRGTPSSQGRARDEEPQHSRGASPEKRRRRDSSGSPSSWQRSRRSSGQRSDDEWTFVGADNSSLADDIERRLAERRRNRSGSSSPSTSWRLQRASDASMADDIERRLEAHRAEVRQRLASPSRDWLPKLRQSPGRRTSRGTTPDARNYRGTTPEHERPPLPEGAKRSVRRLVVHEVKAVGERKDGVASGTAVFKHTTSEWTGDSRPQVKEHRDSQDLEEEDPLTKDSSDYHRLEEEITESEERGERRRTSRVVVRRSVEKTIVLSSGSISQESISSFDMPLVLPLNRSRDSSPMTSPRRDSPGREFTSPVASPRRNSRSGTPSKIRSRTPSVERILEDPEETTSTHDNEVHALTEEIQILTRDVKALSEDIKRKSNANDCSSPDSGTGLTNTPALSSPERERAVTLPENETIKEEISEVKHETSLDELPETPESVRKLSMVAEHRVAWEEGGTSNEVRRYTTRVHIRDKGYTKYLLSTRAASKDSLLSRDSTDDLYNAEGLPSWASKTLESEPEDEAKSTVFRQRITQYQTHISSMKGKHIFYDNYYLTIIIIGECLGIIACDRSSIIMALISAITAL